MALYELVEGDVEWMAAELYFDELDAWVESWAVEPDDGEYSFELAIAAGVL